MPRVEMKGLTEKDMEIMVIYPLLTEKDIMDLACLTPADIITMDKEQKSKLSDIIRSCNSHIIDEDNK
jgi:hypothetical protein